MRVHLFAATAVLMLMAGSASAIDNAVLDRVATLFKDTAPSEIGVALDRILGASSFESEAGTLLIEEPTPDPVLHAQAGNAGATDDFGDDFGGDAPPAAAPPAMTNEPATVSTAPPASPVVPDGWTSYDKLGMGFAAPPDFELKVDEDDEFVVTNSDMQTPKGCAVMGQFDNESDPTKDVPPGADFQQMPERDLGYGVVFTTTRLTIEEDGIDFKALAVISKEPFNEDEDYFQFVVTCANEPADSAQALIDGVLASLHLTREPVLPVPESEKPRLGGLVTGTPPESWTQYRSNESEWILIAPGMQAAASFRLGSDALTALRDLAPDRRFRQFAEEPAPTVEQVTLMGTEGWLVSGRIAPDDPEHGIYNGGMEGPISFFFADRCTPDGDALVVSISAQQSWIDRGNGFDPLLDTIAVHWPEGEAVCSDSVAAAMEAATQASMPATASTAAETSTQPPADMSAGAEAGDVGAGSNWQTYVDPRFGTSVSYPADIFVTITNAPDGQGVQVVNADDTAELKIGGMQLDEAVALDDLMREMVANPDIGMLTSMNRIDDSSFRLDGVHEGQRVTQVVALGDGNILNMFAARYPEHYADLVDRIAASFDIVVPQPAQADVPAVDQAIELAFWDAIKDSTDPADFQAYLDQFPYGSFASLARIRVNRLSGGGAQPATPATPQASGNGAGMSADDYDWQTYANSRFGIVIDYPADIFRALPPPTNNDGRRFESVDGSAGFYVFGQHNALGQSLQEIYQQERASNGDKTVAYAELGQGWFVVSGFRGGDAFYRKMLLSADDVLSVFEISYPSALQAGFDDIVTRMSDSFAANGGEQDGVSAAGPGPNGTYSSGWGDIIFATDAAGKVSADYEDGQSQLVGQMKAMRFEGTWHEPMAAKKCSDGKYWGRLTLDFAADFSSFSGLWSYCDAVPERTVRGSLTSASGPGAQPVGALAGAAGLWAINANGHTGQLRLAYGPDGLSGYVKLGSGHDEILRDVQYDPSRGQVEFLRPLGPQTDQHYVGTVAGNRIDGKFNQGAGSAYSYSWSATLLEADEFVPQDEGTGQGSATPSTQPVATFGPFATPARGTPERKQIIDAARSPVANDIGQSVIFIVDILRSDGHWAYLQATPVQPNGKPMDWMTTRFAADWQADAMSDTVMVLLSKDGGVWHAVDHIVGPTDVYWYGWIDQYQLPETLFHE